MSRHQSPVCGECDRGGKQRRQTSFERRSSKKVRASQRHAYVPQDNATTDQPPTFYVWDRWRRPVPGRRPWLCAPQQVRGASQRHNRAAEARVPQDTAATEEHDLEGYVGKVVRQRTLSRPSPLEDVDAGLHFSFDFESFDCD